MILTTFKRMERDKMRSFVNPLKYTHTLTVNQRQWKCCFHGDDNFTVLHCAPRCLWRQTRNYGNQTPAPPYMSSGLAWQQPHWTWWPLTVVEPSCVSRESLGTSHFGSCHSRFLLQSLFISVSAATLTEGSSSECEPAKTKYDPQTFTAASFFTTDRSVQICSPLCILSTNEYKE